jgi:hypothetical protein
MSEDKKATGVRQDVVDAMNNALASMVGANGKLNGGPYTEMTWINPDKKKTEGSSYDIQRRGIIYPGDSNNGFGLYGPYSWQGPGLFGLPNNGRYGQYTGFQGMTPFGSNHMRQSSPYGDVMGGGVATNQQTKMAKHKMAMAVECYKSFGVIKNVIDLMCNFASEGITVQHPRKAIRRFYQRWFELVDMQGRVKDILRAYYKTSNVFIYTTFGEIDKGAYDRMKSAKGATDLKLKMLADTSDPANDEHIQEIDEQLKKPAEKRQIPWRYTLLNPFQMELIGTKYFGEQQWVFVLDELTSQDIETKKAKKVTPNSEDADYLDETDINLPPEFKKLKNGRVVELDQGKLWTLHYMKDDHEDWADPMIWPVINDVIYKNKLRAMDMSVCDSVINAITLFKIGNLKEGFVAPPEHYDKLAELLRTPTAAMNLIWNDAIEMQANYPPVEKILGVAKYESVDRDILAGLGVSEVIVNGRGGNYSSSFLSVRTLLERLEEGRREVEKWINKQLRMVAAIMGHRDVPTVKFGQMSLRDEQAEKQLVLGLLDRNIISIEAVHEMFGFNFDVELERLRSEKEIEEKDELFIKHGPFVDPMTDIDAEDQLNMEQQNVDKDREFQRENMDLDREIDRENREIDMKDRQQERKFKMQTEKTKLQIMKKKSQQRPNGRPAGRNTPHQKKRDTKPKGMAFVEARLLAEKRYDEINQYLVAKMVDLRSVKYKKALSANDRVMIEELTFAAFSGCSLEQPVSGEFIEEVLKGQLTDDSVITLAMESTQAFIDRMKREPGADERREIRIAAKAAREVEYGDEDLHPVR